MKTLIMNKKEAEIVFREFVYAPQKLKARMWDKVVPYANAYPDLYYATIEEKLKRRKENGRSSNKDSI